jgi:hypothetical protein
MENDEKKYEDVINALKGLQEVKAPANFEADLQRRINSEKFSREEKKSFWQNIFVPAKLIPSLGLVAAAVVIFFVVDTNSEEMDNPFLIEPRVREDVFAVTELEEVQQKQEEVSKEKSLKKDEPVKKNEPVLEKRRDESGLRSSEDKMITGREKSGEVDGLLDEKDVPEDQDLNAGAYAAAESTIVDSIAAHQPTTATVTSSELVTGQAITKEELNFRQVQLTEEEQNTVNELKIQQVQSVKKANKSQK